jgi:hypothetical protein
MAGWVMEESCVKNAAVVSSETANWEYFKASLAEKLPMEAAVLAMSL